MAESHRIWSQKLSVIFLFILYTACTPAYLVRNQPNLAENIYALKVDRIEKQVARNPDNPDLLLKAVTNLTIYSYGFLMEQADREIVINYNKT